MSKEIDDKVVSLEFDNSKFDEPAEKSIGIVEKLKSSFNFKGASNGFDTLNKAIRKVTFQPIVSGIDTVYAKFTMMERFTIQLYDRMANAIINTGKKIVNETFVAPVRSGKSEYELKMGSIQTIMASTGETLDVVNEKLNELNKYSDDTIYSFSDMTNNIGKFTNAGVKLEDAVAAIKGISNEAALSGATANEASRAMYNFAQALSAGSVKIIDWKSIELANMATASFKDELLKTAAELKTVTSVGNGYYKTLEGKLVSSTEHFRDTLQDAWLTSDVLIETLKKYSSSSEDIGRRAQAAATEVKTMSMMFATLKEALQTGWAETWENVIGNFEEAKILLTAVTTELGGFIERLSNARNGLLKFWKDAGGRKALGDAFVNMWRNLKSILQAVREGFRQVFPPLTGKTLVRITRQFEDLTRALKPSPATLIKVRTAFQGFFSIFAIVKDAFGAFRRAITPIFVKLLPKGAETILKASSSLGQMIINLRKTIQESKIFEKFFGRVAAIFDALVRGGQKVIDAIVNIYKAFKNGGLVKMFQAMGEGFVDIVKSMWNFIKSLQIVQKIKDLGKRMADAIGAWPILDAIKDTITSVKNWIVSTPVWKFCVGVVEDFVDLIQKAINKFKKVDTKPVGEFTKSVGEKFSVLDKVKSFFKKVWEGVIAVFETVAPIVKAIGQQIWTAFKTIFDSIFTLIKNSDFMDIGGLLAGGGLGALLASVARLVFDIGSVIHGSGRALTAGAKVLRRVADVLEAMSFSIRADAIKKIAVSVAILAGALFILSAIPTDRITSATAAIMALFQGLVVSMKSFSGIRSGAGASETAGTAGALLSMGVQIMMIAGAVVMLTTALAALAFIPYEPLVKGTAMLILLLRAITREFVKLKATNGSDVKMAGTMIALGMLIRSLAITMGILALAISKVDDPLILLSAGAAVAVFVAMAGSVAAKLQELSSIERRVSLAPFIGMVAVIHAITLALMSLTVTLHLVKDVNAFRTAVVDLALLIGAVMGWILLLVALEGEFSKNERQLRPTLFLSVMGVMLAIGAVIMSTTLALLPLALVPSEKLAEISQVMVYILLGLSAILVAVGYLVGSASRASTEQHQLTDMAKTVAAMVSVMALLSASIISIAAAANMASKASPAGLEFIKFMLLELATLIVGLSLVIGKSDHISRGLTKLSLVASVLISAFVALGVAFLAIAAAFKMLGDLSGEQIQRVSDNLGVLAESISRNKSKIASGIGGFIAAIIETVLATLYASSATIIRSTYGFLFDLLDMLAIKAPILIDKIFTVIMAVLAGLEARAGEIIEQLVKTIISIINALASAIDKHKFEIIEAINRLIDAVISLFLGLFARLFGVEQDALQDYIDEWKQFVKTFLIFGGMLYGGIKALEAINKLRKASEILSSKWEKIQSAVARFITGMAQAGGPVEYIALKLGPIVTKASALFGGHGLLVFGMGTLAVGAALAMRKAINMAADSIEVITEDAKYASDNLLLAAEAQKRYNDALDDRKQKGSVIRKEITGTTELRNRLAEITTENGKILDGYEDEARVLVNDLNDALDANLSIEERQLVKINEQGEAIKANAKEYDNLLAKKRLEMNIDSASEEYNQAKERLRDGSLYKELAEAKKQQNAEALMLSQVGPELKRKADEAYENYKKAQQSFNARKADANYVEQYRKAYAEANEQWTDALARFTSSQRKYEALKSEYEQMTNFVANYDLARQKLLNGTIEEMEALSTAFENGVIMNTGNVNALLDEYEQKANSYKDAIQGAAETGFEIPKETKKQMEDDLASLEKALADAGVRVEKEADQYGNMIFSGFNKTDMKNKFPSLGDMIVAGFTDSVLSKDTVKTLNDAGITVFDNFYDPVVGAFRISSPSKTMYEVGEFAIEGFVNAINDNVPDIRSAMSAAASTTLAAYNSALNSPKNVPTIVPMFDTSAIQNGSLLSSWDRTLNAGTVSARLAASVDTDSIVKGNEATVNELVAMRGDLNALYEAMLNLRVMIDKNTLVGAMAPEMDAALGRRTVYRSKGV